MQLDFALPSAEVAPFVSVFYLFRDDSPQFEGIERADVGQIRFMLKGEGMMSFPGGHEEPSTPIMVNGPGTGASPYRVNGPFHCFGASLRAVGWGSLVGMSAAERADHVTDGALLFGEEGLALLERLRGIESLADMVALVEPFILNHVRHNPVPDDHRHLCEVVRQWLTQPGPIRVADLFAVLPMSERQVTRLVNRYYGGPPKFLERKFRTLRAATEIATGRPPSEVAVHFYDQSHMINEIRHFTGHTPGSLGAQMDPVLAITLREERFGELAPLVFPNGSD
ncbi:helix-turn-helix domain-containing protein [Sphingomonas sp. FW199]|uniref:AraC family transcriptional regulator n=1 Tax=Sphingomonas sp. FW199 TaxID=3400217 RepID=UPI003CF0D045